MIIRLSARIEPLMEKPVWMRVAVLGATFLSFALLLCQFLLRGGWAEQEGMKQHIAVMQRTVTHSQLALLRERPLKMLEKVLQQNAVMRAKSVPLTQQFALPLKASQSALVRWQPLVGPKAEQQGELLLQVSFSRLMHFLDALLEQEEHPALSELNVQMTEKGLSASVVLTQMPVVTGVIKNGLTKDAERDPFTPAHAPSCLHAALAPAWSLSGFTQTDERRFGWLLLPDGRWQRVEAGSVIGTPQWTVDKMDAVQIELTFSDTRCGEQRQILRFGYKKGIPGKKQ